MNRLGRGCHEPSKRDKLLKDEDGARAFYRRKKRKTATMVNHFTRVYQAFLRGIMEKKRKKSDLGPKKHARQEGNFAEGTDEDLC